MLVALFPLLMLASQVRAGAIARGGECLRPLLPSLTVISASQYGDGGPIEGAGRYPAQLLTLIPGRDMFAPAGQCPKRTASRC